MSLSMCGWKPRRRRPGISQASAIFARRLRPCGRPAQPWRAAIADGMDIYTGRLGKSQKATHVGTASKSYTQRMRKTSAVYYGDDRRSEITSSQHDATENCAA
jgi:hypothetical protein